MEAIFAIVRIFLPDASKQNRLIPEKQLEQCNVHLGDLATMSGEERVEALRANGVPDDQILVCLRSLQHLTSLHESGKIDGNYKCHRYLSAHQWSPLASNGPLLGYPIVNSEEFKEGSNVTLPDDDVRRSGDRDDASARSKTIRSGDRVVHHTGLLNQGATCYLNSLLQALFHISEFRTIIFRMPSQEEVKELRDPDSTTTKSIPYALQRLFCRLQIGAESVGTTELTASFGWSSSDSFIQHDVHELTRILLDNLEEKLDAAIQTQSSTAQPANSIGSLEEIASASLLHGDSSPQDPPLETTPTLSNLQQPKEENAIGKLFLGVMENYVRVEEVDYYSSRDEPFYDLQLVVKGMRNVQESFDRLMQVEVLDGKNKYCLERDGEKTYYRAEKGVRLKSTPPIMLLHLARFDFDLENGEMVKILSRYDYLDTLDLSMYMQHAKKEDTHYTLSSVLVHSGSNAGFGHYFCYVRCQDTWYQFNDEQVSPATLKEVFGANFGGNTTNFWGTEIPLTTNAYMLVYVRTAAMQHLLRPIGAEEMPAHVIEQLVYEAKEEERLRNEKAEDYLYGRIHFIRNKDIVANPDFLHTSQPPDFKFNPHRTLRTLLSNEALPEIHKFVESSFGIDPEDQLLWLSTTSSKGSKHRTSCPQTLITPRLLVSDLVRDPEMIRECCVLVTSKKTTPLIVCDDSTQLISAASASANEDADDSTSKGQDDSPVYVLCHHKFYDPLELRVYFLGSTILQTTERCRSYCTVRTMEAAVRQMVSALPDNSKALYNHHLTARTGQKQVKPATSPAVGGGSLTSPQCVTLPNGAPPHSLLEDAAPALDRGGDLEGQFASQPSLAETSTVSVGAYGKVVPHEVQQSLRGSPTGSLTVVCEQYPGVFKNSGDAVGVSSGDVLVWQEEIRQEEKDDVFYDDVRSFQHFLSRQIPVEIRLNASPDFPVLIDTQLADDLTYEQLQRYVARRIGVLGRHEHIRFTRHNQETRKPFFMKGRRHDLRNLMLLLTPSKQATSLSKCLYYEFCKYTVPHIEESHSLQFKYYTESVKPFSSHWVLLPREKPLNIHDLLEACAKEINIAITARMEEKNGSELIPQHPSQHPSQLTSPLQHHDAATLNSPEISFTSPSKGRSLPEPPTAAELASPSPHATLDVAHLLAPSGSTLDLVDGDNISLRTINKEDETELLTPAEAHMQLRLVDVWMSRIFNVFDKNHEISLGRGTFEESAEYRVERLPQPVPDVPFSEQMLLCVCHFTMARHRTNPVETHGMPFSMYVTSRELPLELLRRVAAKLGLGYRSVMDWKLALVRKSRVIVLEQDVPVGLQVEGFCDSALFQPNQPRGEDMAFLGLEHAPSKSSGGRDEGQGVRIYN